MRYNDTAYGKLKQNVIYNISNKRALHYFISTMYTEKTITECFENRIVSKLKVQALYRLVFKDKTKKKRGTIQAVSILTYR